MPLRIDTEGDAGGGGGVVGEQPSVGYGRDLDPAAGAAAVKPPPPRRLPSRRRSSFSVVPAAGSLDASRSGGGGAGAGGGGTSSTAVIVATSRLGAGASGVAFSVNNPVDGREYVLKRVRIDKAGEDSQLYMNEPRLHARVKHGNVISYQYSWVEREEDGAAAASALCILLERADAELWQMLVQSDLVAMGSPAPDAAAMAPLSVGQRLRMGYELSSALAAIHAAGVVHRDLSPWVSRMVWVREVVESTPPLVLSIFGFLRRPI